MQRGVRILSGTIPGFSPVYAVERSDRVIAVCDGREKGGTVRMIRFAHLLKKELRKIPVGEINLP